MFENYWTIQFFSVSFLNYISIEIHFFLPLSLFSFYLIQYCFLVVIDFRSRNQQLNIGIQITQYTHIFMVHELIRPLKYIRKINQNKLAQEKRYTKCTVTFKSLWCAISKTTAASFLILLNKQCKITKEQSNYSNSENQQNNSTLNRWID